MRRPARVLGPTSAADAVVNALRFHRIDGEVREERVITEWTELVGARIAQRTRPDRIADRVLWIEVATSAWLHELNLLKPRLLAGLRERLGDPPMFDDLRLHLAGRRRAPRVGEPVPPRRRVEPRPRPAPPPATGARREAIVREAGAVDDDELRELIARVRIHNDL